MISQPSLVALTKHPWLLEANTQLLSLRISKSLRDAIDQKVEESGEGINSIVRKVLIEGFDPDTPPTPNAIAPPPPPPPAALTPQQEAYQAFSNPSIKAAIKSLAQGLQSGSIALNTTEIITHFLTFCPTS